MERDIQMPHNATTFSSDQYRFISLILNRGSCTLPQSEVLADSNAGTKTGFGEMVHILERKGIGNGRDR